MLTRLKLAREAASQAEARAERAEALVATLLERLSVRENVVLTPARPELPPLVEAKPYISDLPHDDKHWNDFIGDEDDK